MANTNAPRGLIPVKTLGGGIPQRSSNYSIATGYSTSLFRGDPVKSAGTGRTIAIATVGALFLGAFDGCSYTNAAGERIYSPYWPASTTATDIVAHVYDDPATLFEIQVDDTAGLVAADVGQNIDFISGTGSTVYGTSGYQADQSTLGAGSDIGLKIYSLVDRPDNAYGQYAKALVLINEHEYKAAVAGV
jgi:hypothetical protein